MGADAFVGFYGIEQILREGEASTINPKTDDRIIRARQNKLQFLIGRITDGRDYHLLIGKKIADLGLEGSEEAAYSDSDFATIQEEAKTRLRAAGFSEEPKLIFKFHAQY